MSTTQEAANDDAFTPLADGSVVWNQIQAECGDYRDGFVSVFRRYEGRPTDEKDAQGRTVRVTIASFSRHMGIPEQTFRNWVNDTKRVVLPADRERLDEVTEQPEPVVTEVTLDGEPAATVAAKTGPVAAKITDELKKTARRQKEPAKRTTRIHADPKTWYRWLDKFTEWVERYGHSFTEDEIRNVDAMVQKLAGAIEKKKAKLGIIGDAREAELRATAASRGLEMRDDPKGGFVLVDKKTGETLDGCECLSLVGVDYMLLRIEPRA